MPEFAIEVLEAGLDQALIKEEVSLFGCPTSRGIHKAGVTLLPESSKDPIHVVRKAIDAAGKKNPSLLSEMFFCNNFS